MKNKKWFNVLLLLLITIIVLYIMLKDDFFNIINEIVNINIFWLIISILLLFGYWFIKSIILYKITCSFDKKYSYKKAFRLQVLTQFFNAVTPFASGGQPFQIYALKKDGIDYNSGTNIVVQEFIIYQISLVILGIIAIIYNHYLGLFPNVKLLQNLVLLGFAINTFVIILLFILAYNRKFDQFILKHTVNLLSKFHLVKNSNEKLEKWNKKVDEFNTNARLLTANIPRFIGMILLSLIALIALYLTPCVLMYGMGDYKTISGINAIITSAYVMLIGSFVPIPGGTGGIEYGFIAFYGNFIKGPTLSALLLIWRFVTYYMGIIIGSIMINVKGKD